MNIPAAALDELICDGCHALLAGVTYTYPEKQISLCDDCSKRVHGPKFREIAYETIAADFLFPCTNATHVCWKKLKPSHLAEHESRCPFTVRRCILDCGWSGFESQLIEHFTDVHPSKLLHHNTPKRLTFGRDCFPKYLLLTEAQIFEVNVLLEDQCLNIAVSFPYRSPKRPAYRVSISCNNKLKKSVVVTSDSEWNYSEIEIKRNVFDLKLSAAIDSEAVISIPPENHYLLNSLVCFVCQSYMSGRIYFCARGHNCCGECRKEPCICFEPFLTRNYNLESLTEECFYPCRYQRCVKILTSAERNSHELTCEFAGRACPLCACEVHFSTFQDHLNRKHRLHVKRDGDVEFYYTEAAVVDCFYLHRVNGYFKLTHRYSRKMFYFSVQYWGSPEDAGRYAFCVKMESDAGEEFVGEQRCAGFTECGETFDDPKGFIVVPACVLKPFISGMMLRYRVYIYEAYDS